MTIRERIERLTGVMFGTYRWTSDDRPPQGPAPRLFIRLNPPNRGWVNVEAGILGRCVYLSWGWQ